MYRTLLRVNGEPSTHTFVCFHLSLALCLLDCQWCHRW
jgi:hypothetical protein